MAYSDPLKISSICSCTLNWRAKVLCRFCCRSSNGGNLNSRESWSTLDVLVSLAGWTYRLGTRVDVQVHPVWQVCGHNNQVSYRHPPTHSPFVCPCKYIAGYWKGTRFSVCSHRAREGLNHCCFFPFLGGKQQKLWLIFTEFLNVWFFSSVFIGYTCFHKFTCHWFAWLHSAPVFIPGLITQRLPVGQLLWERHPLDSSADRVCSAVAFQPLAFWTDSLRWTF